MSSALPSGTWTPRNGSVAIRPAAGFKVDGTIDTGSGRPKRPVPRVTTLEPSTRFSTGTRIGDGAGGAVRAAASAGDSMRDPAAQASAAAAATAARTPASILTRREAIG